MVFCVSRKHELELEITLSITHIYFIKEHTPLDFKWIKIIDPKMKL